MSMAYEQHETESKKVLSMIIELVDDNKDKYNDNTYLTICNCLKEFHDNSSYDTSKKHVEGLRELLSSVSSASNNHRKLYKKSNEECKYLKKILSIYHVLFSMIIMICIYAIFW